MAKTIMKELIIVLLLCLAIILVLGVVLYEYVPMTKTLPNPVSYVTPDNVKKQLVETGEIEEDSVILTYEVDSNDLNNYKRIQDYKPGKANPFSSYETATNASSGNATSQEGGNNNSSSSSGNNSSTQTQQNTTNETNTQGTTSGNTTTDNTTNTEGGRFFQNRGTK